jgi:hypothetical protein
MAWLAPLPGRLLERRGNAVPRGMIARCLRLTLEALDRTRLIGGLPTSRTGRPAFRASAPSVDSGNPRDIFHISPPCVRVAPKLARFGMKMRYLY